MILEHLMLEIQNEEHKYEFNGQHYEKEENARNSCIIEREEEDPMVKMELIDRNSDPGKPIGY